MIKGVQLFVKGVLSVIKKISLIIILISTITILLMHNSVAIRGISRTVCLGANNSMATIGTTTLTIQGMNNNIRTWEEITTFNRSDYIEYFFEGQELTNQEITQLFGNPLWNTTYSGSSWQLVSINDNEVITRLFNNYEIMELEDLNEMWGTENFHEEVRLHDAIAIMEYISGITCTTYH